MVEFLGKYVASVLKSLFLRTLHVEKKKKHKPIEAVA